MSVLLKYKIDKIDTLITDHIDDLPLMKLSQKNMIVSPNKDMEAQLKQHSISYEIIH
jgi:phosphoserine phosphatase